MMTATAFVYTQHANEIAFPAFGPTCAGIVAAEVVDSQGNIYLWVAEPEARNAAHGQYGSEWDDVAFRDAVHAAMIEVFLGDDSEAPRDETFTLVFDPGSDQCEEWEMAR